jgi:LysM repeat protein
MKKLSIVTTLLLLTGFLHAQKITPEQYVNTYKNLAIAEMKRTGIPASVTLAQGLLETESGNSELVQKSNNHFGIKCKSTWTGESVTHTDDAPNECFRKYNKPEESYRDHSDYLSTSPRYASLFKLDAADYRGWCYGLKKCGYATNPRYPQILMGNIEKYNLQQFDNGDTAAELETFADAKVLDQSNSEVKALTIAPVSYNEKAIDNSLKGKVSFNKLKALFANKGTSLLAIATRADIPLVKLLEYNDLKADGLLKDDQWIYLEKKPKEGNRDYYVALQTETLYDISQNNGVQLQSLMQLNSMTENETVSKGRKIRLRASAVAASEQPTEQVHTVQPKEGLYAISKKYNVPVQQIKELNDLSDDGLKPGQQLIISK